MSTGLYREGDNLFIKVARMACCKVGWGWGGAVRSSDFVDNGSRQSGTHDEDEVEAVKNGIDGQHGLPVLAQNVEANVAL